MTAWSAWQSDRSGSPWSVGIEEEVMLLDPRTWSLAQAVERVLDGLPEALGAHVSSETHSAAVELATAPHASVGEAVDELGDLRVALVQRLDALGLAAAAAGTHALAVWQEMAVAGGDRHQFVFGSMRALARREPTFALHVHVAVPDPEAAIRAVGALRAHLPVLLALSANSPFWQGRDTGLASARTPLFQAFPRVGIPRAFRDYAEYVEAVDLLIRTDAIPGETFLWWDVRPQPRLGTVEVRVMDAQSDLANNRALAALVQCLVRAEATDGLASPQLVDAPEALAENRFIAARDGATAELVDPVRGARIPLAELVAELVEGCAPHAAALGCEAELALVDPLAAASGAERQRELAGRPGALPEVVGALAATFAADAVVPGR